MRQFVSRTLGVVLFLLALCLTVSLFAQNPETKKKSTRSSAKTAKEITVKADEGRLERVTAPVPKGRRTPSAHRDKDADQDQGQGNAKPPELPVFRELTHPREDRLQRGRPFHGDLRTLPQIPPMKFERPEFEEPKVTP